MSQGDVWFVHPFGFDFECYIVPDPLYENLLAASNTGVTPGTGAVDSDYSHANATAHSLGLAAPKGVIGVGNRSGPHPPVIPKFIDRRHTHRGFRTLDRGLRPQRFPYEIHAPLLMPYIKLLVQPPPRKQVGPIARPQQLMVSFHFTHRTGVAVRVFDAGNGTVGIIIVLGDLNPARLPAKHDLTVQWSQLGSKYSYVIDALQIADILTLDIASAIILNRGILTDIYDAPSASSPLDTQNVAAAVKIDQLSATAGLSEDDAQPFPIYGWLNVWWQDIEQVVAKPAE